MTASDCLSPDDGDGSTTPHSSADTLALPDSDLIFHTPVPARRGIWHLSDAFPFPDTNTESTFCSISTLALVRRTPAVFFMCGISIFFITLHMLPFYEGNTIPIMRILATLWMVILASIAMSPTMQKHHVNAIEIVVEVTTIVFVPAFILTTPSVDLSTFQTMCSVRREHHTETRGTPLLPHLKRIHRQ